MYNLYVNYNIKKMDTTNTVAVPENSPISQAEQPTGDAYEQTSEVYNAPDAMSNDGSEANIQQDDLSEKSQNRFQELANSNRELQNQMVAYQQELAKQREYQRQVQEYLSQYQQPTQANGNNLEQVVYQTALQLEQLKAQAKQVEQERQWNEVMSAYPEVQNDVDLDNLIYSTYQTQIQSGMVTTPKQTADQVMKYIKNLQSKVSNETYQKAEENIGKAMQAGVQVNGNIQNQNKATNDLLSKAKAGDEDAVLEAIRKGFI